MSGPAIDLRSDTVTRPTPSMRRAMAEAVVGDDVYGEDPTVNTLEERVAALLGKEAAIYVPSGTMGNLVAVLSHCGRGDEMILGDKAHIFLYERGGSAALGGVQPRTLPNLPDGTLDLDQVADAVRDENDHYPVSRLLALENTHNRCGGRALPVEYVDAAGSTGARTRAAAACRRRAPVECGRGVGGGACPRGAGGGQRERLFFQGAGRAGGIGVGRQPRLCAPGAPHAQAGGRRYAPGRDSGGGMPGSAGRDGGAAGGGSCQRTHPGARVGGNRGVLLDPAASADQHWSISIYDAGKMGATGVSRCPGERAAC